MHNEVQSILFKPIINCSVYYMYNLCVKLPFPPQITEN